MARSSLHDLQSCLGWPAVLVCSLRIAVVFPDELGHELALHRFLDGFDHAAIEDPVDSRLVDVGSDRCDGDTHLSGHLRRLVGVIGSVIFAAELSLLLEDVHDLDSCVEAVADGHHEVHEDHLDALVAALLRSVAPENRDRFFSVRCLDRLEAVIGLEEHGDGHQVELVVVDN